MARERFSVQLALAFGLVAAVVAVSGCTDAQRAQASIVASAAVSTAKQTIEQTCTNYKDVADAFDAVTVDVKLPARVLTARNTSVTTLNALCSKPIDNYVTAAVQVGKASVALYQALKDAQAAKASAQ